MTDETYARLLRQARRVFGHARCTTCGRLMQVAEDDVFAAREELRDEGWVESEPWDGEDDTALARWSCCEERRDEVD